MNYENQELMDCIPGRAPSEWVWEKIEKHLDEKIKNKSIMPEWCYAAAVLSFSLTIGLVVSVLFT